MNAEAPSKQTSELVAYSFKDASEVDFGSIVNNNFPELRQNTLIETHIVDINKDFVTVDVGFKSLGRIPYGEFLEPDGSFNYNINDKTECYLEYLENQEGQIVLSKDKATRLRMWEKVKKICDSGDVIKGTITAQIKGGLSVNIGIKAFLPGSQIDLRPIKDIEAMIGESHEFRILKYDQKRKNIVLSRRSLLEVDREDRKKELFSTLKVGSKVKGHVKNVTDYGLFVDLGGVDGLLHITDMTWGRISHPSELYQIGDEIDVIVLNFDEETQKVSLGLKQHDEDPWKNLNDKYKLGDKVSGKVVNLANYGAFLEIEKGIEGLLHISEMSWTKKIRSPSSVLSLGDSVDVLVKEIDFERKRISLSMRALQENPWEGIARRFPIDSELEGTIRNITDFGIFVEVDDGIDGLIHMTDLSWSQRQRPKNVETLKKDQKIRVKLLSIDVEKGRLSLGVKQLTEDPWKNVDKELHIDDEVQGKVVHIADFGVFVELKEGVEGLIHFSEIGKEISKRQLSSKFPLGSAVAAKIIKIDANERRLALSPVWPLEDATTDAKISPPKKSEETDAVSPEESKQTKEADTSEPAKSTEVSAETSDISEADKADTKESAPTKNDTSEPSKPTEISAEAPDTKEADEANTKVDTPIKADAKADNLAEPDTQTPNPKEE